MTAVEPHSEMTTAATTLRSHWQVYAIEGALLGTFMVSACFFTALLEHPGSPVRNAIASDMLRRALIGVAMGLTAVGLIYSPWGKRSGAHMNPAMTLSFLRLGRIAPMDAAFYIVSQFTGAAIGVALMSVALRAWVSDPSVNYAVTAPGRHGTGVAWIAEFVIAFLMLTMVLTANRQPRLRALTGCFAGCLVATYITFEAPLSGMSINPARTFGSAINANLWTAYWVYLTAPVAGMLAAIEASRLSGASKQQLCGKLTHSHTTHCFIKCNCIQEHSHDQR